MVLFKFDGKYLKDRTGKRIAEVDRNYIKDSHGRRVGEIDRLYVKDSRGQRLIEFDGRYIKDNRGQRIGTPDDVMKLIDGPGGMTLIALWVLFVR